MQVVEACPHEMKSYLSFVVNTMAVDDLAIAGETWKKIS